VLEDDSRLVIAALVDERDGIVLAVVEGRLAQLLRDHQRMPAPDRGLVVKVAAVGLAEIVAIKLDSRIG
jgi:hypothetical protein